MQLKPFSGVQDFETLKSGCKENAITVLTDNSIVFVFDRIKPMHYISWLLGHEGPGSVLSLLIKR